MIDSIKVNSCYIDKITTIVDVLMFSLFLTIPRSFLFVKLVCIVLYLIIHSIRIILLKKGFKLFSQLNLFYIIVCLIGVFWSIWGLLNDGNIVGVIDNFRLYVIWGVAFFLLFTIFVNDSRIENLHYAILLSGMMIFFINIFGLINIVFKLNLIPEYIIKEMDMMIGIHQGYVQIMTHNIGSLLFITPYLFSYLILNNRVGYLRKIDYFAFFLSLIVAFLSGRRALWLALLMTPIIIYVFLFFTSHLSVLKKRIFRSFNVYMCLIIISFIGFIMLVNVDTNIGFVEHLKSAFSSQDERSIQKSYLYEGFYNNLFLGSGFGVYAGYTRNLEAPWLYELTYHQILFNFGLIGVTVILLTFISYVLYIFKIIKICILSNNVQFAIIIGVFTFFIGAYSNPYFGSFDFILIIGFIPLVSVSLKKVLD